MAKRTRRVDTPATVFEKGKHRNITVLYDPETPYLLTFRAKGCRFTYSIPIAAMYELAAFREADATRKESKKR